jgi:gluconolactonase
VTPLITTYNGKKFNSPNDVVVKSDGSIWFTDPPYGLPKGQKREIDKQGVYCFKDGKVTMVASDFDMPNGPCFSQDEKKLYIADSGKPHHIRVFDVGNGQLKNDKVFTIIDKGVPDGIRCDQFGNIWSSAGDGVQIFAGPDGHLVGKILVPETPANLCFGGLDGKTLFITARHSLYSVNLTVTGATQPGK